MDPQLQNVVAYYTEAGPDYRAWSRRFNMHFGYWRHGMSLLDLEGMLEEMNRQVLDRLELDLERPQHIVDLGCGLGATARSAAARSAQVQVAGLTLVPWQIKEANTLDGFGTAGRVRYVAADFTRAPFADGSFDGAYALESSCYAPGTSKELLVREAYRLLKPGKRFVVADAFLKTRRPMGAFSRRCYRELCDCWSLETWGEIHDFQECLEAAGFGDVHVVNISKNVTPSVLHIPATIARFFATTLIERRRPLSPWRWRHIAAGPLLIAFAMDRTRSGYFLTWATKR
jgi:MPBQ/MSBQ methyltransferase